MLFQTLAFLVFFAVVYPVYVAGRHSRWCTYWLLAASYFFYGWWNPFYLILMAGTTVVDWVVGLALRRFGCRKTTIAASVVLNLGLLGVFKYGNFLAQNLNWILTHMGLPAAMPTHDWLLPVGISFYTFQSMSYTIDVYRGKLEPERNLATFALYVSFFPQLVAGPIERAGHLLGQMKSARPISWPLISSGASLFLLGLFKKAFLGDFLGLYVQTVYGSGAAVPDLSSVSGVSVLLATYAFAWQIYFDFSGYTDMARGIARAMGFSLMENFNAPYLAAGPREFWQRWHISLSTWLRDYLYIPLGGNRGSGMRTAFNLLATMLLGGLWHGNTWNFVVWGAIHGIVLVLGRSLGRFAWLERIPLLLRQLLFFHVVCLTWVFFRAPDLATSLQLLGRVCFHFQGPVTLPLLGAAIMVITFALQALRERSHLHPVARHAFWPIYAHAAAIVLMILASVFLGAHAAIPFIYFQF
jgi:D-alanyl-lipoteichoic acid acyltransferase DltB (MBOAT superfamily)